jgi:hypothetical protein
MYQILIGQTTFEGSPISNGTFFKNLEGESLNYEELTKAIVEGLKANVELMLDTEIVDSLAVSPLNTVYDLLSLQYLLAKQKVQLLVTKVNESVISEDMGIMVKIVTPIRDAYGIPKAIDFPFGDKVDLADAIKTVAETFDLFNGTIFLESPIGSLLTQIPRLEDSGLSSNEVIEEASQVLRDLGFSILSIYRDGQ